MQRHDSTSLTIGVQCASFNTPVPARGASSLHRLDEEEVLEEEERAVANTALYIASTGDPSAMLRFWAKYCWGSRPVHRGREARPFVHGIGGMVCGTKCL